MAGLGIRLFTDEMIPANLARALRQRGYDAESCQESGHSNQEIDDEAQLEYATQQGRAMLTYNIGHFLNIDRQWKVSGRRHAGIIVSPGITEFGDLLRRVQRHLDNVEPATQDNLLLWL